MGKRDGLGMGPRHADHPMTEAFNQRLDIHGDKCLILDNQNVSGDLGGELTPRFFNQIAQS